MILIRQVREPHAPNNKPSETSQRQHLILHEAHWPVINVEVPVAISGPSRRLSSVVECRSGISIATLIFILFCLLRTPYIRKGSVHQRLPSHVYKVHQRSVMVGPSACQQKKRK